MPAKAPTADDIHNGHITFVSLDTQVIQSKQYQLDRGALGQLPGQLPASVHLVLTQVVTAELMGHRVASVAGEVKSVESALSALERQTGRGFKAVLGAFQGMDVIKMLEASFDHELKEFVARCNGFILPWADVDPDSLFQDYFQTNAPFEEGSKKKSEFPDAASLQILEHYAEGKNTKGIVVSDDNGWARYCASSDRLYHLKSLDELAALFVATDEYSDKLEIKVKELLADPNSALRKAVDKNIDFHISLDSSWDTSDLVAEFSGRLEVDISEANVADIKLGNNVDIWFDEDDDEPAWIVHLTAKVEVDLTGSKDLFIWDGVDKEEILIASEPEELVETVEIPVYMRLTQVRLDEPDERWGVNVDIASGSYDLAGREISFDMR